MRAAAERSGAPTTLLCDADGNLFPSESPAFEASVGVTNRFLATHGVPVRFEAEQLRLATTGVNFRALLAALTVSHGIEVSDAERDGWVVEERDVVTRHLARELAPDPAVKEPLARLGERFVLAAVSSSATKRLGACLEVTELAGLIPPERRFSAEDSLAVPTSKPDPAIYRHACEVLGVDASEALAIEDSVPGAQSAGIPTVGNVQFVPPAEREQRREDLLALGVCAVVASWSDVESMLSPYGRRARSA